MDHMKDCEKVLQRLEDANLTFSGEKSTFKLHILVVGHLCGAYGRKPSPSRVNAIKDMKEECITQTEVRRFLGACAVLPYLDSALRSCRRAIIRIAKEKKEVRMARRAYIRSKNIEEITSRSSNTKKGRVYRREADLCDCRYEPNRNRVRHQLERRR